MKLILSVAISGVLLVLTSGFRYHSFCDTPPNDLKTRFPLYKVEVDSKLGGMNWAYRQNDTITVTVKALYQKFPIRQIFISVPSLTKGSPEVPAKRIHLGEWKWDYRGGVIPTDCTSTAQTFGGGANAVRDMWWRKGNLYNITSEWDPINTIPNAFFIDVIQFELYVSPDPKPENKGDPQPRWVKLKSEELLNMDFVDLHRFLNANPYARTFIRGLGIADPLRPSASPSINLFN